MKSAIRWTILLGAALSTIAMAEQRYFLVNDLSGRCIDVTGAPGVRSGDNLLLVDCEKRGFIPSNRSPSDQLWQFHGNGFIVNALSGKCLDVEGAPGHVNGTELQIAPCEFSGRNPNGSPTDQRWAMIEGGFIVNLLSKKCIDVAGAPGTANGRKLVLWDCELEGFNPSNDSPTDQRWQTTLAVRAR